MDDEVVGAGCWPDQCEPAGLGGTSMAAGPEGGITGRRMGERPRRKEE